MSDPGVHTGYPSSSPENFPGPLEAQPPFPEEMEREAIARKLGDSLRENQDRIIKEWLKGLIDDLGMTSLKAFPTQELTRDLPDLIGRIADHLQTASASGLDQAAIVGPVATISAIRKEDQSVARMIRDFADLKRLMLQGALQGLRRSDRALIGSLIAMDDAFGCILQAGLQQRPSAAGSEPESVSETDSLTDLYNVRFFRRHLHRQLEIYKGYRTPFSLIMLDLDGLGQLNETLGMAAGDEALKNLAAILLEEKRDTDIAVRYGGDEFFLILPGTVTLEGERLAYRISRRVKELNLSSRGARMTGVSLGVVSCPENGMDVGTLRARADKAMYMAKLLGGNRVARYRDFQQT